MKTLLSTAILAITLGTAATAHAEQPAPTQATAQTSLSRADVRSDLADWRAAGFDESQEIADLYEPFNAQHQQDFAKYQQLRQAHQGNTSVASR